MLTNGFKDEAVEWHAFSVQVDNCSNYTIPKANAEFSILVPTCKEKKNNRKKKRMA